MLISKSGILGFHSAIAICLVAIASGCASQVSPRPQAIQSDAPVADGGTAASRLAMVRKKLLHLRRLPDHSPTYETITLRQASLFQEQLIEWCEEYRFSLHYQGALGSKPITQGARQAWDPTVWTIGDVPDDVPRSPDGKQMQQMPSRVILAIRLTESKPQSGIWSPIMIEGRRFYVLLDESHGPKADAAIDTLGGLTPRDLFDALRWALDPRK